MKRKNIVKTLLFPHIAIMIMLVPISVVFLIYSMIFLGSKSITAIISYVLAAYTLTVWCFKIPYLIRFFKSFKENNKYAIIWQNDTKLRMKVSLYWTLMWNTAYAVFQLGLGFWHRSFWYYSLAGYYIFLAVMRFFLVSHIRQHEPGEEMQKELFRYRVCGIILLFMNIALALIIFFMVYWNRTFNHNEITAIAMAAYTFVTFAMAIVNVIKYQKYNSPVYSASKAISLTSASVSMLTLESTLLTVFGGDAVSLTMRRAMLGLTGGIISVFVITMAVYMITQGAKKYD